MIIHALILVVKIIVWIAVAFRNVNKEYFYLFLLIAFIDPFYFIIKAFITFSTNIMYVPTSFLLYVSLKPSHKSVLSLAALILAMFMLEFSALTINLAIIASHFFMAACFIRKAIIHINAERHIDFFYPVLFLFAASTIVKSWIYTFDKVSGLTVFFVFDGLQLLLGVFMLIYSKEKSPKISLKMIMK